MFQSAMQKECKRSAKGVQKERGSVRRIVELWRCSGYTSASPPPMASVAAMGIVAQLTRPAVGAAVRCCRYYFVAHNGCIHPIPAIRAPCSASTGVTRPPAPRPNCSPASARRAQSP